MLGRREHPFPFEAVRDLLELVRAMHAAARARGAGAAELTRIEAVGRALAAALDLAAETEPDTVGGRAAWARAEKATAAVGSLVAVWDSAEPIIRAACARVRVRRRAK